MGACVWWNWISKPHSPWARLWQAKYAPGSQWSDLIRINTTTPGSSIWNSIKLHNTFIQEHIFWEIHSGTTTRFWEDSWQQLPKLAALFHKPIWQVSMQPVNLTHIHQFWQQHMLQYFQLWKPASTWQADWQGESHAEIDQELNH